MHSVPNTNQDTTTEGGTATKTKEYVERIGVVLFQVREDGIYVLMEHIDNPTGDLNRLWKFPQGVLDEHNKHGGFNGRNFLKDYYSLTCGEARLWEIGLNPIDDPLKSEAAILRKGFKRTITTWASFETEAGVEPMTEKLIKWVPQSEILNVCETTRIESYSKMLAEVLVTHQLTSPPLQH